MRLDAEFIVQVFRALFQSVFLLDSGADTTTIFAEGFNGDITTLSRASIALTAGGVTQTHQVQDAVIVFVTTNQKPHAEFLELADIISLPDAPFHGLLGMDILGRFKWKKSKYTWFLER